MSNIRKFNFINEAIKDFELAKNNINPNNTDGINTQELLDALTITKQLLVSAIKFIIPNGEELLGTKTLDEIYIDSTTFHLPYPIIALEYEVDIKNKKNSDDLIDTNCNKRIAVAAELIINNKRKIKVLPLWTQHIPYFNKRMWFPNYASAVISEDCFLENGKLEISEVEPFIPSLMNTITDYYPKEHFEYYVTNDLYDETVAIIKFIQALSCSNVEEEIITPSKVRNKLSKSKKYKQYNFNYKVLKLNSEHRKKYTKIQENQNQKRKSPKFHIRRGHVRKLPTGGLTWIPWMTVGDTKNGMLFKDYLWS
jgi:hypothetical protein